MTSQVKLEDANEYAQSKDMPHLLTTACSKLSIEKVITDLIHLYHQRSQTDPDFKSPTRQFRDSKYEYDENDEVHLRSKQKETDKSDGCAC